MSDSTSCSGTCRRAIFPFSFCSWQKASESDVYRGAGWGDLSVEKLIVSTCEEEDPIGDVKIDDRSVLSCLRIVSESTTQHVDEKGIKWFIKTLAPSVEGSMIMRSHLRIRSRDLTSLCPAKEPWANAALIGSYLGSCQCAWQRVAKSLANNPFDYCAACMCRTNHGSWGHTAGQRLQGAGVGFGFAMAGNMANMRGNSCARQQPQRGPAESKDQAMSMLKQLGELKAAGILTDIEFDAKKKELLAKL